MNIRDLFSRKKNDHNLSKAQMKELRKAQQGELDAALMYSRLARKVTDPKDDKAFLRLASDEMRHAGVFMAYTGSNLIANPAKAIFVPLMYKLLGKEKLYPVIAKAEYKAADKYKNIIDEFPDAVEVMNDEVHHGDAVMDLLN